MVASLDEGSGGRVEAAAEGARAKAQVADAGATVPTWTEAAAAAETPPTITEADPGIRRGWQHYASSFVERSFRELVVVPASCAAAGLSSFLRVGHRQVRGCEPSLRSPPSRLQRRGFFWR